VKRPAKKSVAELKSLSEELALEAAIATHRADIVEANVRRLIKNKEFAKLRSELNKK